jgi:hypothetical protein
MADPDPVDDLFGRAGRGAQSRDFRLELVRLRHRWLK